jgi:plastocyanin
MLPSFYDYVIAGESTTGRVAQLMIAHGVLGMIVAAFALYLVLRMRTEVIPPRLRIGNIKLAMRATLALWTLLVLLGVGIYAERYLQQRAAVTAPLLELRQLGADLYVHAFELQDAAARGSAPAVTRHAEHLINLIEGKDGLHYGDNNIDGHLEDPGDGIGLLSRLETVAASAGDPQMHDQSAVVRGQLERIVALAVDLLGDPRIEAAKAPIAEILELAQRANGEGVFQIEQAAREAGVVQAPMLTVATEPGGARTVTIHEDQFQFLPSAMTIPAGTTVIWVNDERPKHTATADDGLFDSGDQGLGDDFAYTFAEPGVYPYFCRYHGDVGGVGMAGTIEVK